MIKESAGQKSAAPQTTISRLESKYSDILDRVAKRKQRQQQEKEKEDRDKTIEPEYRPAPLMKSQTTANITKPDKPFSSSTKDRTPFRLDRNNSKYASEVDVKMKRSDLIGLSGSSSNATNYHDGHDSYTKMNSNDSGYYDGYRNYGKENIYKSKYDPEVLYSDIAAGRENGTKRPQQPYAGSSTSRQIKPYKRTETGDKHRTAINLYELLSDEESEVGQRRHQYTQRKSTGNQLRASDNQRRDFYEANEDQNDFEKTERENRRKEIESLIKKYAQMDDLGRPSGYNDSINEKDVNISKSTAKTDPWDLRTKHSPVVIPKRSANQLGKSQTMANIPNHNDSNGYSSYFTSQYNSKIVPIKTNITPSSSKSRMSKALSTFVRTLNTPILTVIFLLLAVALTPLIDFNGQH